MIPTSGAFAALDHARGRGAAAAAWQRLDRPLPGAPGTEIEERLGGLSDLVHQGKMVLLDSTEDRA
jgi:hypothetical protein